MNLKIKKKEFLFYNYCLFNMVCYILQGEVYLDDGELDDVRMLFFVMDLKKSFVLFYIVNISIFFLNYESIYCV